LGINPINPYGVPLFNTVILLRRGATLTWAHHNLLVKRSTTIPIVYTLVLATMFEVTQYVEYKGATFSISDGVYGRVFYFGTGFHGIHVILGHLFLAFNLFRLLGCHFTRIHHLRFEFAAIY